MIQLTGSEIATWDAYFVASIQEVQRQFMEQRDNNSMAKKAAEIADAMIEKRRERQLG